MWGIASRGQLAVGQGLVFDVAKGWAGYIDEFAIDKGVARWTVAFDPPTEPYGGLYTVDDTGTGDTGDENTKNGSPLAPCTPLRPRSS